MKTTCPLHACSYENRPEALDGLILMVESVCQVDPEIRLHLTVPEAPEAVQACAKRHSQVVVSAAPPDGVAGWDVKPRLLLQELEAGAADAVWLDADLIVTRSLTQTLREFPPTALLVAEEWDRPPAVHVAQLWDWPSARPVRPVNSCFIRATPVHRPLLQRWREMTRAPRYREAQARPFEQRPWYLASDQVLLTALLGSAEFAGIQGDYLNVGRHIVQCAGSSGYRPIHRLLDLGRGLPPLIHCIGRKPWMDQPEQRRLRRYLLDLAVDVSPYVLAARRVACEIGTRPPWVKPRTSLGSLLRTLGAGHPGLAGMPLAIMQALGQGLGRLRRFRRRTPMQDKLALPLGRWPD
jgi:hypothetical protein